MINDFLLEHRHLGYYETKGLIYTFCFRWLLMAPLWCGYNGEGLPSAMAAHSSTLAWKIPWTQEPGGLQSVGSLRVGHD